MRCGKSEAGGHTRHGAETEKAPVCQGRDRSWMETWGPSKRRGLAGWRVQEDRRRTSLLPPPVTPRDPVGTGAQAGGVSEAVDG